MYKITGADQKEYGPVSADQVRRWITEGRASGNTLAKEESAADWKPLSAFPEFAESLAAAAAPSATPPTFGAPTGVSSEILAGDYDLDIGQCLSNAWDLLKNNFGMLFGGVAIYLLIQGGLSAMAQIPIAGAVLTLVSVVIMGPLTGGVYYFMLKHIRHQPGDIGDIFSGFRLCFGQLVLCYLVMAILIFVSAIPGMAVTAYPIYLMVRQHAVSPPLVLWAAAGLVVAIIPVIYLGVSWIFSLALVVDRQMEFWPALGVSRKMVGKHWWPVFGLVVVCALIKVAGLLVCCLGLFISMPLVFAAMMYAYESIFSATKTPAA